MSPPISPTDVSRKFSIPKPPYGSKLAVIKYEDRLSFEKIPEPTGNTKSAVSALRIWKEIRRDIIKNENLADTLPYISISPIDGNLHSCLACIEGGPNTSYEGGVFWMHLEFPKMYPHKPPRVKFLTPIYHPNVNTLTGYIGLGLLDTHIGDIESDDSSDGAEKKGKNSKGRNGRELKKGLKMRDDQGKIHNGSSWGDWERAFEEMSLKETPNDKKTAPNTALDTWLPVMTIESLLVTILSVIESPVLEIAIEPEIAKVYRDAYEDYHCEALCHTQKHAIDIRPNKSEWSKEDSELDDGITGTQTATDSPTAPPRNSGKASRQDK